ncbi:MAG: oxygenase MpaB family protein [Solirubrobacteraceae bacterium]
MVISTIEVAPGGVFVRSTSVDPDRYFPDDATIRRVLGEYAVALSGPRVLLMMAAHPVAFEGFFMSTGALDDPYARLQRTAVVMDEIIWGSKEKADAFTSRVRTAHATVRGTIPADAGPYRAGTAYAADDPELLLWILACLVDAADLLYRRYVGPLTRDERDALWQDYRVVGECFGLRPVEMPADIEAFDAYVVETTATLWVTPQARELGRRIVLEVPVPRAAVPLREAVNQMTIGLLPARVRRGYGLRWDPARSLALKANQAYVRRFVLPLLPGRVRKVPSARTGQPLGTRLAA